jgi:hypothetical protein
VRPIPLNDETRALAESLVWFEPPAEALADPVRFLAYVFARATHEQMKVLSTYVSENELLQALDQAPPGIIDPRSWAYWNARIGRVPVPPLPKRRFR